MGEQDESQPAHQRHDVPSTAENGQQSRSQLSNDIIRDDHNLDHRTILSGSHVSACTLRYKDNPPKRDSSHGQDRGHFQAASATMSVQKLTASIERLAYRGCSGDGTIQPCLRE